MRPVLLALLLAGSAHAAPRVDRAAPAADNPLQMATGAHLQAMCGARDNIGRQLVCVSWINGAAQVGYWYRSRNPVLFPDFCPADGINISAQQAALLDWLAAHPRQATDPALLVYRTAMAAAYPCPAKP